MVSEDLDVIPGDDKFGSDFPIQSDKSWNSYIS
jgi:hypothetical protein